MNQTELIAALKKDRTDSYIRLSGGFPLPLAGAVYWLALGGLGYSLPLQTWLMVAMFGSGLVFPLGLLIAKLFNNDFMKDKQAVKSVLLPALIGMLLFWPMLIASLQVAPQLAVLILAIGMFMHWPVAGWSYNRVFLFSSHSVVRALVVYGIWMWLPDGRLTLIPFAVGVIYLLTVLAILVDTSRLRARNAG